MWAAIKAFFVSNAPQMLEWLGIIAAALGAVFAVRQSGKDAVRAENNEKALEVKHAQQQAAADAPRDRDGVVDELRNGKF